MGLKLIVVNERRADLGRSLCSFRQDHYNRAEEFRIGARNHVIIGLKPFKPYILRNAILEERCALQTSLKQPWMPQQEVKSQNITRDSLKPDFQEYYSSPVFHN